MNVKEPVWNVRKAMFFELMQQGGPTDKVITMHVVKP
mgnify:CR=1 FL=1